MIKNIIQNILSDVLSSPFGEFLAIVFKMAKSSIVNLTGEIGTFTRATPATVEDHEDVIREVLLGEARFQGQRRVENLISPSEDFSGWVLDGTATVTGQNTVNLPAVSDFISLTKAGSIAIGEKFVQLISLSGTAGDTVTIRLRLSGSQTIDYIVTLTSEAKLYALSGTATATSGSFITYIWRNTGDTATEVTANYIQIQNKTGASDPTIPDSYVSTGVLSAPYHGAGVDGVKYFLSSNGNSVP